MENKKFEKVMDFLKNAFCIDGDIKYMGLTKMVGDDEDWAIFELNDSKRGKFMIAMKGSGISGKDS